MAEAIPDDDGVDLRIEPVVLMVMGDGAVRLREMAVEMGCTPQEVAAKAIAAMWDALK